MKTIISDIRKQVDVTTMLGFGIARAIDNGTPYVEILQFIQQQGMDEPCGMADAIGWKLTKDLLQLA